ncbi:MAG TPA: ATP-binding protein [Tepidisphaeraceae bacterium]|jgi:predicted ATPase
MAKIVLTGGPGAGKSVISRAIASRHGDRFVVVPEAATAVYADLGTRWDRLDLTGRRRVQRQIYQHQLAQEERLVRQYPNHTLLLDRGTLDGAAYWPDGPDAYWADLQTRAQTELNRYDTVLWLETAAALGIYDGDASNPVRFESPAAAVASGRVLLALWGDHPNLHRVDAFVQLEDKIAAVMEVLELLRG